MLARRFFCVVLGAFGLTACASLLPPGEGGAVSQRSQLQSFALEGRFSLRHEDKSTAGRLSWRHAGGKDELLLASPFGLGMAEIISDATGARLTAGDGTSSVAVDAETLTQQVLGYSLPLHHLRDWVRGIGAAGAFEALDAFGRPLRLRQEVWQIDYEYDNDDPQALPGRLFVRREGGLELRLRIDEWRSLDNEDGRP
jgi:outer membrane lipoprotein LolB